MEKVTGRVKALAKSYGAVAVGIATTETLAGGPPSTDLTYVLPEARSAVTFALALDQDYMVPWFNKRSHADHFQNNIRTNVMASEISLEIANYLQQKSFAAVPLASNAALLNAVGPYLNRPKKGSFVFNALMPGDRVELTCGNCQLICHPDKAVRKARYKMLIESGVIVEHPDGTREAVTAEEAKKHMEGMPPEQKALYEYTMAPMEATPYPI